MYKYEKAWQLISVITGSTDIDIVIPLKELVDKEIPMKPLDNGMSMSSNKKFNCRICKEHIYHNYKKHTRCHECGQKIDWSIL